MKKIFDISVMVRVAKHLEHGIFEYRENRFVGYFKMNGQLHKCHILNPGRMENFLNPGAEILVENRKSPKRKIAFSLLYVIHPNSLILIDSQLPNKIIKEALQNRVIDQFKHAKLIKPEQTYGKLRKSRIDFLLDNSLYIEVKATNFVHEGIGYFPDAPSIRAQKHITELCEVIEKDSSKEAYIIFLAQRTDITEIRPFDKIDPKVAHLLRAGAAKGIRMLGFLIKYAESGHLACLGEEIPINLQPYDDF
ncbi:Sugar fermentation stimulation protein [Candidatus Lokiarchaeum ossiferum]|uniref:Sugar fermentation stimulation protein n=1 Tax=Candidatus Lokiarchaeum ossiferum TaxID=2951803 RepID=A0ABY6HMS7_9ARCH|nr:Sugar fermentation stimulation protein [Candidatus Lokiarchaeum sp. B-35]